MRFVSIFALILAAIGIYPLVAQDAPEAVETTTEATEPSSEPAPVPEITEQDLGDWMDGRMTFAVEHGQIAGAVVTVVKDGEILLERGYGYADQANRTPVDPATTLFRTGSVSKLITWTAVMQQVEAGRIDLDADVNTYLDFEIPPFNGQPITMRQIMTHTPGFEEAVRYMMVTDPEELLTLEDYAKRATPARVFAPGTTPAYSNYATALAGYIVERVSGQSFDDYTDQNIFAPLGMEYSTMRQPLPDNLAPHMSLGYPTVRDEPKPFEIVQPAPAGSQSASGRAMAKFMIAHLNQGEGLMSPETARMMHDYRAPGFERGDRHALGFYEENTNGRRVIAHGGDTQLFHSGLWLFEEEKVGIFVSVNSTGGSGATSALRLGLLRGFADRYFPETRKFEPVDEETAREHAQMLAGTYTSARGSYTSFLRLEDLLGPTVIAVGPDGKITVPGFDGYNVGARDWVEVESFFWRDMNSGETLVADVKDGVVTRFSLGSLAPVMVYNRTPTGINSAWLLPAFIGALLLAFLTVLLWPINTWVRRSYGASIALSGKPLKAYRWSRGFALLVVLTVTGWLAFLITASADFTLLGGSLDLPLQVLRTVTPIAALGLFGTAAWYLYLRVTQGRRWPGIAGAALLTLAGLVFIWVTYQYNLYGYSLTY